MARENDDRSETGESPDRPSGSHPIDGIAFLKAAALASVPADRLSELLWRVQADLGPRINDYRRRYERIAADAGRETFLAEPTHWEDVADRLGLSDRERDAVARAHEAAVERVGSEDGRRTEFDTALEIRAGVVIGLDAAEDAHESHPRGPPPDDG